MSLINKMLRDLNARHATEAESALPDEVRPLPEASLGARLGRSGWLVAALLTAGGGAWLFAPQWPHETVPTRTESAVVTPVPSSVTAPASSSALADELVPSLPTLTNAMPLTPPGMGKSSAAAPKQAAQRQVVAASVALRLDEMLTFAAKVSRESPSSDSKPDGSPALKLSANGGPPSIQKESHAGAPVETVGKEKIRKGERHGQIEKVERGEPGDVDFRNGIHAFKQGRVAEAIARLHSALQENPRHAAARHALLGVFVEQKRWDDAQALLKNGLDLMPEQSGWAMALARIQVERGNAAEALEILNKYQAHAEHNAEYQGFAAVLLQHQNKPREAAQRFKAALQIKPREGRWWYALGNALDADNQSAEAIDAYKRAQTLGGLTPAMAEALDKKLR